MVRIVSFVLALSVVSTPSFARSVEDIRMECLDKYTSAFKDSGLIEEAKPRTYRYLRWGLDVSFLVWEEKNRRFVDWCSPDYMSEKKKSKYSSTVSGKSMACKIKTGWFSSMVSRIDFKNVSYTRDDKIYAACRLVPAPQ